MSDSIFDYKLIYAEDDDYRPAQFLIESLALEMTILRKKNTLLERSFDIACEEFATQTMFRKEEVKEIYINKAKREIEDNG